MTIRLRVLSFGCRHDGYTFREGTGADQEEERERSAETSQEYGSKTAQSRLGFALMLFVIRAQSHSFYNILHEQKKQSSKAV
jgi:hypothetical protein